MCIRDSDWRQSGSWWESDWWKSDWQSAASWVTDSVDPVTDSVAPGPLETSQNMGASFDPFEQLADNRFCRSQKPSSVAVIDSVAPVPDSVAPGASLNIGGTMYNSACDDFDAFMLRQA